MYSTSRRQFLRIGLTASAWPLVAGPAQAAGVDSVARTPLLGVVYDTRFAASVAFGESGGARGLKAHAIAGDMTQLWYDEIYHCWRQRPTALAGLTGHGPLFCFAELARDVGMRVVFRAEHRAVGEATTHTFTGPTPMLSTALDACAHPSSLWTAMADVVAACPLGRTEIRSAERTVGMSMPHGAAPDAGTLYTWVIAPAVRA